MSAVENRASGKGHLFRNPFRRGVYDRGPQMDPTVYHDLVKRRALGLPAQPTISTTEPTLPVASIPVFPVEQTDIIPTPHEVIAAQLPVVSQPSISALRPEVAHVQETLFNSPEYEARVAKREEKQLKIVQVVADRIAQGPFSIEERHKLAVERYKERVKAKGITFTGDTYYPRLMSSDMRWTLTVSRKDLAGEINSIRTTLNATKDHIEGRKLRGQLTRKLKSVVKTHDLFEKANLFVSKPVTVAIASEQEPAVEEQPIDEVLVPNKSLHRWQESLHNFAQVSKDAIKTIEAKVAEFRRPQFSLKAVPLFHQRILATSALFATIAIPAAINAKIVHEDLPVGNSGHSSDINPSHTKAGILYGGLAVQSASNDIFSADVMGISDEAQVNTLSVALQNFYNEETSVKSGDSLWSLTKSRVLPFGNWENAKTKATKADVVANLLTRFLLEKGINPRVMHTGDSFSLDSYNLGEEQKDLLNTVLDSQSFEQYMIDVYPQVKALGLKTS